MIIKQKIHFMKRNISFYQLNRFTKIFEYEKLILYRTSIIVQYNYRD